MKCSGPRRDCTDAERDALCLHMSGHISGAGQARLQSGECQSGPSWWHLMIKAFCGMGGYSMTYHVFTFILTWIASDLFEFAYHLLGHSDIKWEKIFIHLSYDGDRKCLLFVLWAPRLGNNQISLWRLFSQINIRGSLYYNLYLHQIKSPINW